MYFDKFPSIKYIGHPFAVPKSVSIVASEDIIMAATAFSRLQAESSGGSKPWRRTLSVSSRNASEVNISP
jgi:hypothetical protein